MLTFQDGMKLSDDPLLNAEMQQADLSRDIKALIHP